MSQQMASEVVKRLKAQFGKSFPEAGMKLIWKELCEANDKALEDAFDFFVLNNRFPSPQQLKDQVTTHSKLIAAKAAADREDEWNKTKGGATRKELERSGSIFTAEQRDEHGKAASMCLVAMGSDRSRKAKLEFFRMMEDRYPGIGWGMEGVRLQKHWDRQDTRPHWRDVSETSLQFQMNYRAEQERKNLERT